MQKTKKIREGISLSFSSLLMVLAILTISFYGMGKAGMKEPVLVQSITMNSGAYTGNGTAYSQVFTTRISNAGGPWLMLHFTNVNLGTASYIELVNSNGGIQVFDGIKIRQWNYYSAFFNGDHVDVSLYAAPADNLASSFFEYNGARYVTPDSLRPGHGYFIKVKQDGKCVIPPLSRTHL